MEAGHARPRLAANVRGCPDVILGLAQLGISRAHPTTRLEIAPMAHLFSPQDPCALRSSPAATSVRIEENQPQQRLIRCSPPLHRGVCIGGKESADALGSCRNVICENQDSGRSCAGDRNIASAFTYCAGVVNTLLSIHDACV
jgi:hypothetical protein